MIKTRKDLTGLRFGKLTVLYQTEDRIVKSTYDQIRLVARWCCVCDCGNTTIVDGASLNSGHTKSCGCYNIEKSIETNKRYNEFKIQGDTVIMFPRFDPNPFIFDIADLDKVKKICWHRKPNGYIAGCINRNKHVYLHRFILDATEEYDVDHINGDPSDNRRINIRLCSRQQNSFNKSHYSDSASGFRGVSFNKAMNKWESSICVNKKQICLGYFEFFQNAILARLMAEKQFFGEFRRKEPIALFPLVPSSERNNFKLL